MPLRPEEITSVLEREIQQYDRGLDLREVGTVLKVGDSIATIYGLMDVMAGELLEFPHHVMGMVLNLEESCVGAALLGYDTEIKEGDPVKRTKRILSVPAGEGLLGRVVDSLGRPIDGKGPRARREDLPRAGIPKLPASSAASR